MAKVPKNVLVARLMATDRKNGPIVAAGIAAACIIGLGLLLVGGFAAAVFIVEAAIKWLAS